jgi:hypothetical protein
MPPLFASSEITLAGLSRSLMGLYIWQATERLHGA